MDIRDELDEQVPLDDMGIMIERVPDQLREQLAKAGESEVLAAVGVFLVKRDDGYAVEAVGAGMPAASIFALGAALVGYVRKMPESAGTLLLTGLLEGLCAEMQATVNLGPRQGTAA